MSNKKIKAQKKMDINQPDAVIARLVYFMNSLIDCETAAKSLVKAPYTATKQEDTARDQIILKVQHILNIFIKAWKEDKDGQDNS